jgi:hypothetical protein
LAPAVTVSIINGGVLTVQCDNGPNTVTVDHLSTGVAVISDQSGGQSFSQSIPDASYNSILINGGNRSGLANRTLININGNVKTLTAVSKNDFDQMAVGNAGGLAGILGVVALESGPGSSTFDLAISDQGDTANHNDVQLTSISLTGLAPAEIIFGGSALAHLDIAGGDGNNTYTVTSTPITSDAVATVLSTGNGDDTASVQGTTVNGPGGTALQINAGGRGNDVVNVGDGGTLAGIQGILDIESPTNTAAHVNINDGADTTNHDVHLSAQNLTGLAPVTINFGAKSLDGLTITGGNGDNTWGLEAVTAARAPGINPITLNTGTLHDVVNVAGTDAGDPMTLNTGNALNSDVVNVGNQSRVSPDIAGPLTINNAHGASKVNIDDSLNGTSHPNAALSGTSLTGFATGPINFGPNALGGLTISGGFGNNTFTVNNTPASGVAGGDPVVLNTGNALDTVNVVGTAATAPLTVDTGTGSLNGTRGNDVVNVGNGTLAGINGTLTLINTVPFFPSSAHVNINDQNDNADHPNVLVTDAPLVGADSTLAGLSPVAIKFESISVNPLTITVGNGNNTYTINQTEFGAPPTTLNTVNGHDVVNVQAIQFGAPLTVNAGSGNDVVNVGNGGTLNAIHDQVNINAAPGAAQVNFNDGADNTPHANVALTTASLSGLAPSFSALRLTQFNFGPNALRGLNITVGIGNNTYTVVNTPPSTAAGGDPVALNTGNGNDVVKVQGTSATAPLTVNAGSGKDTISVGSTANTLDPIQGAVTVRGGDTLNINDQGSTTPHSYNQTLTTLDRSGAARITFTNIANLHINKGPVRGPMLTGLSFPPSIKAGQSAALKGRLVDPQRGVRLSLVVNWGDGSGPQKITPGLALFTLRHRGRKAGSYTVHLVWSDSTGLSNSEDLSLTVTRAMK